ncbi:MAG: L,D-transpeptidase, partial [Chloroflexota bacterium]|nr:L,D-transpeptidase [Chloroflexota bacterium]
MRRCLPIILSLFILILLASKAEPAEATSLHDPGEPHARAIRARYVCVPSLFWRNPELCPSYGPGATPYRIASIRLPDPLPELPVLELPQEDDLVPHTYAYVKTLPLDVYRHPMEAAMGLPPARTLLSGDWWVSVDGAIEYEGQRWYQINADEFVIADALALAGPSRFQGVYLTQQPSHPFAWINRWTQPAVAPQVPPSAEAEPLGRYQVVTIFAEEQRGDEIWYLIGPDQWVEQVNIARADVDVRPEGVPPGAKWIEVDLYEQTIAAYEGDRMVYATLISSGRTGTATPPGLYTLWSKIREGKMSTPDVEDGSPAWYYLEDVPWTMYFHEGYSIHTAYWHDAFGFTRSHGCVNLAPRDAKWFFTWADPFIPDNVDLLYMGGGVPNTWVWVHFSSPF